MPWSRGQIPASPFRALEGPLPEVDAGPATWSELHWVCGRGGSAGPPHGVGREAEDRGGHFYQKTSLTSLVVSSGARGF